MQTFRMSFIGKSAFIAAAIMAILLTWVVLPPLGGAASQASPEETPLVQGGTTLAKAVKSFNETVDTKRKEAAETAKKQGVDKNKVSPYPYSDNQPPLTVEEVIAAIRSWDPATDPNQQFVRDFKKVADTGLLPPNFSLNASGSCVTRVLNQDWRITVWWIDLTLKKSPQNVQYTLRVRDVKLMSDPLEEEK